MHHLWFDAEDYRRWGTKIKCNPAIKADPNKQQILQALLDDRIDVVATDHAPHTIAEKGQPYWQAPAGLPLVQHSLKVMLEFVRQDKIPLERVVEKTSHAVADCFEIKERGYIREGYYADLVLVDLNQTTTVRPDTLYAKGGWSPFEGTTFHSRVTHTFVSGHLAYAQGVFDESVRGKRLVFSR